MTIHCFNIHSCESLHLTLLDSLVLIELQSLWLENSMVSLRLSKLIHLFLRSSLCMCFSALDLLMAFETAISWLIVQLFDRLLLQCRLRLNTSYFNILCWCDWWNRLKNLTRKVDRLYLALIANRVHLDLTLTSGLMQVTVYWGLVSVWLAITKQYARTVLVVIGKLLVRNITITLVLLGLLVRDLCRGRMCGSSCWYELARRFLLACFSCKFLLFLALTHSSIEIQTEFI